MRMVVSTVVLIKMGMFMSFRCPPVAKERAVYLYKFVSMRYKVNREGVAVSS